MAGRHTVPSNQNRAFRGYGFRLRPRCRVFSHRWAISIPIAQLAHPYNPLRINPNHNTALQKNCKALYHYVRYVGRIADNVHSGMENKDAVEEAVEWAVDNELLDGYFKEQRAEMMAMSLTEFDLEDSIRTWRNDGIAEGREEKAIETAQNLLRMGLLTIEQIAQTVSLSPEQVKALAVN